MEGRITEAALVLPALYLMSLHDGKIGTSDLIKELTDIMHPRGEDVQILDNRRDTRFSQIVRNLKSHNTFNRNGFADYEDGCFQITKAGQEHLEANREVLNYLLDNNFSYKDITDSFVKIETTKKQKKIEVFDEEAWINEGGKKETKTARYDRSARLRDYAREKFTIDGQICCTCCGFNFNKFYGQELGRDYIEIHHIKPIFKYEDEDMEKTLKEALKNLVPLCSNCHSMIHRNRKEPLDVETLKEIIENTSMKNTIPIANPII